METPETDTWDRDQERKLRLECLKLASGPGYGPDTVARARQYADFVLGKQPECEVSVAIDRPRV